jgi:hypothetical protein
MDSMANGKTPLPKEAQDLYVYSLAQERKGMGVTFGDLVVLADPDSPAAKVLAPSSKIKGTPVIVSEPKAAAPAAAAPAPAARAGATVQPISATGTVVNADGTEEPATETPEEHIHALKVQAYRSVNDGYGLDSNGKMYHAGVNGGFVDVDKDPMPKAVQAAFDKLAKDDPVAKNEHELREKAFTESKFAISHKGGHDSAVKGKQHFDIDGDDHKFPQAVQDKLEELRKNDHASSNAAKADVKPETAALSGNDPNAFANMFRDALSGENPLGFISALMVVVKEFFKEHPATAPAEQAPAAKVMTVSTKAPGAHN